MPERDTTDVNIILALDASGSTGYTRQLAMSSVCAATVRALEETGTKHSFMIYDSRVSVVSVDSQRRTNATNILCSDMTGGSSNNEGMVLDIASTIAKKNMDRKNIIILISDGGVADVRENIEDMKYRHKQNPINTYCLGYGKEFDDLYAKKIFGEDYAMGSTDPKEFGEMMIKIILKEVDEATRSKQ